MPRPKMKTVIQENWPPDNLKKLETIGNCFSVLRKKGMTHQQLFEFVNNVIKGRDRITLDEFDEVCADIDAL